MERIISCFLIFNFNRKKKQGQSSTIVSVVDLRGGSSILIFRGDRNFTYTYSPHMNNTFLESTDPYESVKS